MQDILKPYFKTYKEIVSFEEEVDSYCNFLIHYYNNYILKFLNYAPAFSNLGIGFSKGDDKRNIVELIEFAKLYYEKGSKNFQNIYDYFSIQLGANRFRIDDSHDRGDKISFAKYYIYYFNSMVNIGIVLLTDLNNQDLFSCKYKPVSDDSESNNKEENLDIESDSLNNKESFNDGEEIETQYISPEEEVEEYLRGEREIDELSPDAETWLYEEVDDD